MISATNTKYTRLLRTSKLHNQNKKEEPGFLFFIWQRIDINL